MHIKDFCILLHKLCKNKKLKNETILNVGSGNIKNYLTIAKYLKRKYKSQSKIILSKKKVQIKNFSFKIGNQIKLNNNLF